MRWFRNPFRRRRVKKQSSGPAAARPRLSVEPLEDRQLLSVAVLPNPLGQGGDVRLEANGQLWLDQPGSSVLLDNACRAATYGVLPNGQSAVFDLQNGSNLYAISTSGWQLLDNGAGQIAQGVAPDGSPALFDLKLGGGSLYRYGLGGWQLMDKGAGQIAQGLTADGRPAVFDLKAGSGSLYQYSTDGWQLLDNGAGQIAQGVAANGAPAVFDLKATGNSLYRYGVGGWQLMDNAAGQVAQGVTADGRPAVFDLKAGGNLLYQYSTDGWHLVDNAAGQIVQGPAATGAPALFDLKAGGTALYRLDVGGWQLLDNAAGPVAAGITADGRPAVFDLKGHNLYSFSTAGWQLVDSGAAQIAQGRTGTGQPAVFDLNTGGSLYQLHFGGWGLLAGNVTLMTPGTGGHPVVVTADGLVRSFDGGGGVTLLAQDLGGYGSSVKAPDGSIWFLGAGIVDDVGGHGVYRIAPGGSTPQAVGVPPAVPGWPGGASQLAVAHGQVYAFQGAVGVIYDFNGTTAQQYATGIDQMAVDSAGDLVTLSRGDGGDLVEYDLGGLFVSNPGAGETYLLDKQGRSYGLQQNNVLTVQATANTGTIQILATGVLQMGLTATGQLVRLESDGTVWQQSGGGWVQIGHDGLTTGGVARDIWMLGMTPVPGTTTDYQAYRLVGGQLKLLPGAFNRFLASGVSAVWAADSHNQVYVGTGGAWSRVSSVVDYDGSIWFMGADNTNFWSAKNLYHYTGQRLSASSVVSGNYSQVLSDEYYGKNGGAADNWIWLLTPSHQVAYRQQNGTFTLATQVQTSDGSTWALGPVILAGYPGAGLRYVVRYDGTQLTDMGADATQITVQSDTVYITANGTTEKWNGSDWVAVTTSGGSGSLDSWEAALTQAQQASAKTIPSLNLSSTIDLSQSTVTDDLVNFLKQFAQGNEGDAGVNNLSIDLDTGEVSGSFWVRCHQSWGSLFGQEVNAYDFTVSGNIQYNFYTQDVGGDIELGHGIDINLQDLYDATRGDFTGLIADCTGVSQTNDYAQVAQPGATRYFASQSFVDWAGPETLATWAVEGIASGGSSLAAVPGEIAAHLTTEAQGIAAWLQARLGNAASEVADQVVNALVSRQNLQTPLFSIQWQPVDYYYASALLPALKTPPISHLGFAINLTV